MSSFLTFLATPLIKQVSRRIIFGKPYTHMGSLFCVVGFAVYQAGGVLGYSLRDSPGLLAKLAVPPGTTTINEAEIIEGIRRSSGEVESALKEVEDAGEDEEKTFFHLYTVRELRIIGVDLIWGSLDENLRNLRKKTDADFAGFIMRMAFVKGIHFGFNFPEQFAIYWDNTHRIMLDSRWQELRQRGIILSEKQHKLKLNEAIVEMAEGAIVWNENQSPRMLDHNDTRVLQAIIEANKES